MSTNISGSCQVPPGGLDVDGVAVVFSWPYFGTSRVATAPLTNGDEFYNPTANTWSRTNRQCGTGVSYSPLALLGTGKA